MVKLLHLLYDSGDQVISESLTPDEDFHSSPIELANQLELFRPTNQRPSRRDSLLAVVRGGTNNDSAYPIFREDAVTFAKIVPLYVGAMHYFPIRANFSNHSHNGSHIYIFDQEKHSQVIKIIYDSYTDDWEVSGNLKIDKKKITALCALLNKIGNCLPGDIYD